MNKLKIYFAQFKCTPNDYDNKLFYKFGITGKSDAFNRFAFEKDSIGQPLLERYKIRILASSIGIDVDVRAKEEEYLKRYPKTFSLKGPKWKGITEISLLSYDQVGDILKEFKDLKELWSKKLMEVGPLEWGRADTYTSIDCIKQNNLVAAQ